MSGQSDRIITDPDELISCLCLPKSLSHSAKKGSRYFPLCVPESFINRITPGDIKDPLLMQIFPTEAELNIQEGFSIDPVQDHSAVIAPGLIKKYHCRALLMATGRCALHCRFCFRRHYKTKMETVSEENLDQALLAIEEDKTLSEVILSGGDPLTMPEDILSKLINRIEKIRHIKRIRVHTRFPVVMPENVTDTMISLFTDNRIISVFVLHINHFNEINESVRRCVKKFIDSGIMMLNQSVLLKGVNDTCETLVTLFNKLVDLKIFPYYIHQMDRVAGAAHFFVDEETGKGIMRKVKCSLPGYAVPKYVKEVPGNPSKVQIL